MALTAEQQAQIDLQEALQAVTEGPRRLHEQQMEATRHTNAMALAAAQAQAQTEAQIAGITANAQSNADYQAKQIRLEAIRLAKETLIENARSKPVDARDVSAADVQAFAQSLVSYING